MKKLMITFLAAGALAVPVGVAVAQDDVVEPDDETTTVEPFREREQQRLQEHDGECDGTQNQERSRIHVDDRAGVELQERNRIQVEDGSGVQEQERNQFQVDEPNGTTTQPGRGQGPGECSAGCSGDQLMFGYGRK